MGTKKIQDVQQLKELACTNHQKTMPRTTNQYTRVFGSTKPKTPYPSSTSTSTSDKSPFSIDSCPLTIHSNSSRNLSNAQLPPPKMYGKISPQNLFKESKAAKKGGANSKKDHFNEDDENAVYEKYTMQKQSSKRNVFENIPETLRPCLRILNLLKNSRTSWPFREPVDPVALGIPHYIEIVKQPMDLSTIENNLRTHQYVTPTQFHADVAKIVSNSYLFNVSNPQFTRITEQFENYYQKITSDPSIQNQRGYGYSDVPAEPYQRSSSGYAQQKRQSKPGNDYSGASGSIISMAEKKELSLNIKKLQKQHMKGVLDIVNEGRPKMVGQFDLKDLDSQVIRKLQQYVKEKLAEEVRNRQENKDAGQNEESSFELDEEDDES